MKKLYVCSVLFLSVSACKQRKPDRGALPPQPTCHQDLLLATTPNVLDTNRIGFGLSGVDRSEGLALLSVPVGKQNLPEEVQSFVRDGVLVLAMGVKNLNVREEVAFSLADKPVKTTKKPPISGSRSEPGNIRSGQDSSDAVNRSGGEEGSLENSKIDKDGNVIAKELEKKEGENEEGSSEEKKKNIGTKLKEGVRKKWQAVKQWSEDHPKLTKMGKWGVGATGLALLFHVVTQDDDTDTIYVFGDDLPKELTDGASSPEEGENIADNNSKTTPPSSNEDSNNIGSNSSDAQKDEGASSADSSDSDHNVVVLDVGQDEDATAYVVDTDKGEISNITVGVQGEHDALQDPTLSQTCGPK